LQQLQISFVSLQQQCFAFAEALSASAFSFLHPQQKFHISARLRHQAFRRGKFISFSIQFYFRRLQHL
jgi:hypothetical protein